MNQKRIFWMVMLLLVASLDISLARNLQQNHRMFLEQSQLLDEEEALAQLRAFELEQDAFASLTGQKKKNGIVMEKTKERKTDEVMDEDAENQEEAHAGDMLEDMEEEDAENQEEVHGSDLLQDIADEDVQNKNHAGHDADDEKGEDSDEAEKEEDDADVSWKFSFGFSFDLNQQKQMIENILAYLFCQTLDADELEQWKETEQEAAPELYEDYINYVQNLLADAVYFPVPEASNDTKATVSYENSWQSERTYGGTRGHEGCDLMASVQQRGYYPVVSVSDGVVEKIGWLPQGGYRIGIRSRHGVYYYYAHLAEYEDGMAEGVSVAAGQLIGYMGDTGYSEVEGTTGNFPVHLHFGMYLDLEGRGEVSFNPYYLLGLLEKNKLRYIYQK